MKPVDGARTARDPRPAARARGTAGRPAGPARHLPPPSGPVAFQGEQGAFSEAAAAALFGETPTLPCRTLREVFAAVADGRAGAGVVPIENSHAGSIHEAYDLLLEHDLAIVGETALRVDHCLLGLPGQRLEEVRQVFSHPQALAQCEEFVRSLGAEAVAVYDTAGGARIVRERGLPGTAAIASERAARLYGLEVLARGIETAPDNTTRFYAVRRGDPAATPPGKRNRTALALALREDDAPGALFWCLATLAYWQVNLLKIESRPSRQRRWHYVFYLDLDAHVAEPHCRAALDELARKTTYLRILGSFPRADDPQPSPSRRGQPRARPAGD
jgi:prephenate dehydratase